MKEISVVQLPEYLAQSASAIRRIDYDLSIYLEETIIQKIHPPNVHGSTIYNSQDMEAT